MSQAPYMPLFVDAFLADTWHLTAEEVGCYITILMNMWRRNGSIPNDQEEIAFTCRMKHRSVRWRKMWKKLEPFFTVEGDRLTQKRLKKEWNYVQEFSEKQRQNANARWNKNKDLGDATAYAKSMPNECPHTHTHTESENLTTSEGGANAPGWQGRVIKLNAKDLGKWTEAYPRLDLSAELLAYDQYLAEQGVKSWFARTSQYLANRNMKAKAQGEVLAKPLAPRQTQVQRAIQEHLEEIDAATSNPGTSRRAIRGPHSLDSACEFYTATLRCEDHTQAIDDPAHWQAQGDPPTDGPS
jgi:uncharacterized protein YdaU (DUF1376 family)